MCCLNQSNLAPRPPPLSRQQSSLFNIIFEQCSFPTHRKFIIKALHFLISFLEPPQMFKKNYNEDANTKLTITSLPTNDTCTIFQNINFFQILSTKNSSTFLTSKFNPKGTPNNLDTSLSFAHL